MLVVPETVKKLELQNRYFPDLVSLRIHPDNAKYATDGKMLYSKDRKTLLYSLTGGMQNEEAVLVPREVTRIGYDAFKDSLCEKIIFQNSSIRAERDSFDRSRWLSFPLSSAIGNLT